jgi:hypothetical protein
MLLDTGWREQGRATMAHYVREIPPLRTLPKLIDAKRYNCVQLALLRLGSPLRLRLPDVPATDVILNRRTWLAVDSGRDDLPVLAWTGFQNGGRSNLHLPVACQLHLYHYNAGLLMGIIGDAMDRVLTQRLAQRRKR